MSGIKHRFPLAKVSDLNDGDRVVLEVYCDKEEAFKFVIGSVFDAGRFLPDVAMIDYRFKSRREIIWYGDNTHGLSSDSPLKVGHLFKHNNFAKYDGKLKNFKGFK